MCFGITWINLQGFLVTVDRFRKFAKVFEDDAQVVMRFGILGIDP